MRASRGMFVVLCCGAIGAAQLEAAAPMDAAVDGQAQLVSPIRIQSSLAPVAAGTRVTLEPGAYERLSQLQAATLTAFPLGDTERVDLDVQRFEVFSADAKIVVGTSNGDVAIPKPQVALFRGTVVGESDSEVYLAITPNGANGWIRLAGRMNVLSSGPRSVAQAMTITPWEDLPEPTKPWECGTDNLPLPPIPPLDQVVSKSGLRLAPCWSANIAVDTDYEYTQIFGGSTAASTAYVATLFGAINTIYQRDHDVTLNVSFLRVWATDTDPYSGNDFLYAFQDEWNANMTHISRSAAHFLSGRPLGGGVAYLNALCFPDWDYGASSGIQGWFPTPLAPSNDNWDLIVVSHELGHNFGSHHTHCYSPPIDTCYGSEDGCYIGGTSLPPGGLGTIMSYCHTLPGGLSNMDLAFHTRVQERVLEFLQNEASCDLSVACSTSCVAADVNCDGNVDAGDILVIRGGANWNLTPPSDGRTDVDGSGTTDAGDILVVRGGAVWNTSTGPCTCP